MKGGNGAYYGFDKDVDADEAVDCTSVETEADEYHPYFGDELQLTDKYGMKRMTIFHQGLCNADGNYVGTGN